MPPRKAAGTLLSAAIALILILAMIKAPDLAFSAALRGLKLWWEIVFPALLPFFIGSEILMGLGVVHGLGVLLEPLMRPLFDIPGEGGFVVAMGLASGYPIGALLTVKLRRQGTVDQIEGERLMSFANTADPLFMTGAVAVGMFGRAALGPLLMLSHYLAALIVGFLMRFWGRGADSRRVWAAGSLLTLPSRALSAIFFAREKDGRPIGQLLGEAIRDSVNTLLLIGGFIILFAVILRMLDAGGVVGVLVGWLTPLGHLLGLGPQLIRSLLSGIFEITIGTQEASRAAAPLLLRLAVASTVIGWAGLSVLAQVAALVQGTDLRLRPYVLARLTHAVLAGVLAMFFGRYLVLTTLSQPATGWPVSFWRPGGLYFLAAAVFLALILGTWRSRRRPVRVAK